MATSSFWRGLAPVWLRILAGLLLFPILWLVFQLLGFGLFPAVRGLTENLIVLLSIIAAGIAAAVLIRKSSMRRALVLSSLALLAFAMGSLALIGSRSPPIESRYGGSAEPSEEPPDMAAAEPPTAPPDMAAAESPLTPVHPLDEAGAGQPGGGYHYEIPPELGLSQSPAAEAPGPDLGAPSGGGMLPGASDHQILFGDPTLPPPQLALPDNEMIVRGQPPERSGQLPEFPWPPPSASASYVLPDKLFESYRTLGDVSRRDPRRARTERLCRTQLLPYRARRRGAGHAARTHQRRRFAVGRERALGGGRTTPRSRPVACWTSCMDCSSSIRAITA